MRSEANKLQQLKAFSVQGDEFGTVVFAHSGVVARREGANELNIEFEDVESCRRAPGLDRYAAAGHVPWRVLVEEHGWRQCCGYCERPVDSDDDGRVWVGDDQVYCTQEHAAKHSALISEVCGEALA